MRGVWFLDKKQYRELLGVTAQILHLLSQLIPQLQRVYNVKYFIILNVSFEYYYNFTSDAYNWCHGSQSNVLLFDN